MFDHLPKKKLDKIAGLFLLICVAIASFSAGWIGSTIFKTDKEKMIEKACAQNLAKNTAE